jgi:hypothetical protein
MTALTWELRKQMVDTIMRSGMNLIYRSHNKNVQCYCEMCGKTYTVTKDQFKEIRNSHMCPECWREVVKIQESTEPVHLADYVSVPDGENSNGYQVEFKWNFNHASWIRADLVARFYHTKGGTQEPEYTEVKGIHLGPFWSGIHPDSSDSLSGWKRKTKTTNYYRCMYINGNPVSGPMNRDIDFSNFGGKRAYLEAVIGQYHPKSSQMQIAIKHILKPIQMQRMVMFDLNDYNIVKTMTKPKENSYYSCKLNDTYEPAEVKTCMEEHLNMYDAKYIQEHNIDVTSYLDYLHQCKELHIKNKHPHVFGEEHAKLSAILREREDMNRLKKAERILPKLAEILPEYHGKEFSIIPVQSAEELKKDANYMNNCIFGYLDKYMQRLCFLYIVRNNNGKILANVELQEDKIIQIRARYNEDAPKKIQDAMQRMVLRNAEQLQLATTIEVAA